MNQLVSERPSIDAPKEGPTASPVRETPSVAPRLAVAPAPAPETDPRIQERASEEQIASLRLLMKEAGDYNLFHGLPGRNVVLSREAHDFMTRDEPVSAAAANEAAESLKAGITAAAAEQELHRIYAGSALLRAGFDPETVEQKLAAWDKRVPDPESIDKAVSASAQPATDVSSWQDRRLLQDLDRRTSTPPAKVEDLDAEQELARRLAAETGDAPAWTGYVERLEERRQTERQTAGIRQRLAETARTAEPKGFPVAAELRAWDKEGISDLELYERLAARGVGVIPPERLRPDERRDYSPFDRYGRSTHKSPLSLGELFARRVGAEDRAMEHLREPYTSAPAVPKRRPLPAHWKGALQPDGSYEIGVGGPVQPRTRERPREMPLPAAEPVPAAPPPEPAAQLPAVTIEPVILDVTPEPRPARRHITSSDVAGSISRPTPAPDPTPDRQPVTVEAVKEAGGSALVKTTPKPRKHVQAPQAEACPAPVRTARRPQPRAENGSAAPKPKRARRKSDFTPAEIRRFRRAVSRMKR